MARVSVGGLVGGARVRDANLVARGEVDVLMEEDGPWAAAKGLKVRYGPPLSSSHYRGTFPTILIVTIQFEFSACDNKKRNSN